MDALPDDFEQLPCPACGGRSTTVTLRGKDWELDPTRTFQVVRCDACGLHHTMPRPRAEALGKWYPSDYSPYRGDEDADGGGLKHLIFREAYGRPSDRPTRAQHLLARAVMCIKRPESFGFGLPWRGEGRLLDFGCGGGKFLRRMASVGWDVTGLDFSEHAVEAVRAAGQKAFQGTLPHPQIQPRSFDVVTMRHALEHVPDPIAILNAAKDVLVPGGLVHIQVPNHASWELERFGESSMGLDLPRHLLHFTPKTLADVLRRAGFEQVKVWQVCRSSWLRKSAKRVERRTPRATDALYRNGLVCRIAARICQMRGKGNELFATGVAPAVGRS